MQHWVGGRDRMRRFRQALGLAGLVGFLAACAPSGEPEPPPLPDGLALTPVAFTDLPGWSDDRVSRALPALRRSCGRFAERAEREGPDVWVGPGRLGGTLGDWVGLCRELARAVPLSNDGDEIALRAFLEGRFQPYAVSHEGDTEGTFTGYYEAELRGARTPSETYPVPLHGVPEDLVTVDLGAQYPELGRVTLVGRRAGRHILPYWTRAEIEDGALDGSAPVLLWAADPVDVHILHIQGSGRVVLPDGTVERVGYAGNNGHRFVGVGRVMLDAGLLEPGKASMPAIREWLRNHPEQARAIMRQNPRYIFFRRIHGEGPIGAFGVPLTPRRSLAVDTRYVPLGVPLWLSTRDPDGGPLQRLMVAQDVGSAIKGAVRGDFFWGYGEPALAQAGRMKSRGRWYLLLPRSRAPTS